ncbi:MAG: UvrD-helicase domain-containing protein [Candidatus Borkfalkiaceae bacterium]|nr:UvrD-helicase domain-containing protein [Christensenellaceae bacterium]
MINKLLAKLNDEQIKPVLDTEGAVLVIAGAGSGKTRVLTTRIAYLIEEKQVPKENILAITFTNKAANEMRERMEKISGDCSAMWICTIHSMCVKILRSNIDKIGYDRNFTIYDETDKDKALKRIVEDLGYEADTILKTAKNHISIAKNECLSPDEYEKANPEAKFIEEVCKIYEVYEDSLARSNSLDFDDLLFKTYVLFKKHPEVADYYSEKFRYIHIDEFQDTNTVQFAIAKRLSVKHGNIFVVGDDDQSIYSWRGAKIENILEFDGKFVGAKVYKLERNYRSTKKILELANALIENNKMRRGKTLWTDNSDGVKIETFEATDENNEAAYVAMQIKNLLSRTDYTYKDFAVFMRVNAISRAFEQEFTKYAIPYKIYGGFRFFERKEIKDLLAYLKIVNNPYDDESFIRAVTTPKRGIGDKTLRELREFCSGRGVSMREGLTRLDETSISSGAKAKLFNFKLLLDGFTAFSDRGASALIDKVVEDTDFLEQFSERTDENNAKIMNVSELKNSAVQFEKENNNLSLSDYLNSVTLSSDTDAINTDDAVTVATIHASKGLEFKCVFVAGLDEGILPVSRSRDNDEDMEEERRLMYVAVTRAKERLYLTRATERFMYGKRERTSPSLFFKEARMVIDPEAVKREEERRNKYFQRRTYGDDGGGDIFSSNENTGGYSSNYAKRFLKDAKPKAVSNASASKYRTGLKVKHPRFGEGTVIMVRGEGDNVIVDVAFPGVGIKSLAAKFAPMEII